MPLTKRQEDLTTGSRWDFSGLRALFVNCTLKPSPAVSNTQGLMDISVAIMEANGVTVDQFSAALLASDPGNITIKETTDLNQNGLAIKKVVNTTAVGADKTHYLFWHGSTLIVVSVILQEDEAFAPVLASLRAN